MLKYFVSIHFLLSFIPPFGKNVLIILLWLSFFNLPFHVTAEDFKIAKISPEGGFTYEAISSVSEDKFGFIWFGSSNGVYRYNSVSTIKYINTPGDRTSLPGNLVRSLYLDLKKNLWIATGNGLAVFNYQQENFKKYSFHDVYGNPKGINVLQIVQTADSSYWMVDNNGFGKIDLKKNLVTYLPLPESQSKDLIRMAIRIKGSDRIWLGGMNGGIYYTDPPYQKVSFFARERKENVYAILPDRDQIWAGYLWGGADRFSTQGMLIEHFGDDTQSKNRLPSLNVRTIFRNKDEIWIGTFKGLVRIKPEGTEIIEKEKFPGLQNSSIFQIYRDSGNGIWIGTWSGGLSYINEWSNSFEHFRRESLDNSLSDNVVSDFEETSDGSVIAATEEGHLNYLDKESHKFLLTRIKGPKGLVFSVKSMFTDRDGTLWIGTYGSGIFYQKLGSREFVHFDLIDDSMDQIFDIAATNDGIWFGSSFRGAFYYSFKNRQVKNYMPKNSDPESLSSTNVKALLVDSNGNLWAGTMNGLNKKSKDSEKFTRYFYNQNQKNRISSNNIYSLMEDSKKNIWIGTAGGGVNIYDPKTETFTQLSKNDGLPGIDVYGILEDDAGVIWMSTENGISAYSPVTRRFRNFDYSDGLQGNQFNPNSAFKSKNGELFFGGSNGFTRFDPKMIKENPILPKAYITGLEINNQVVSHQSDPELVTQSLMTLDLLVLNYNQNSLKFEFVASNFLLPQKNRFKYRLTGYSPDWIEIQKDNKATFTKIPPGSYIFEVIAANNDGKWNDKPTRLHITIKSPFWSSWYAFVFYIGLLIVIFYVLQRELRIRNKLKNSILNERIQRDNEEKLHQLKLHFFTNISHEFRTPLTLILSPLSILKRKIAGQDDLVEHVSMIENNANRLLRLVNQILDIRKIELGKVDFHPQPFDIVALTQEVFQCFSLQDNDRRISFVFESDFSSLLITIEPDKIDKLIFNLLSNAMKYQVPEGTITLAIKNPEWQAATLPEPHHFVIGDNMKGKYVTIIVKNEGEGIIASDLPHIFERFYQSPGQIAGTGIGLHLCSEFILMHRGQIEVFTGEGMGATFFVRLPVTEAEIEKGIDESILHTIVFDEQKSHSPHRPAGIKVEKETKILVVEDNKEMQKFLTKILSDLYSVTTADDGIEGLKIVKEFSPDLVLTDVMMPGMDGNEFCNILKADLNTSHIPILILTALSSVESQLKGFETGADDYVVKPFDDRILLMRIRNLLDSRAKLRENFTKAHGEWHEEMQKFQPDRELLDMATATIENHLVDANFSVDILASELNLSRSSLHRKLRALTDQSATEFIKFVRINKSIKLIENGETNIDEICFKVGFNSHSYYSMCFKKQLGVTPSEFISRLKRGTKGIV
jgi:signal transduction histidine kinase/DNA-binding response OmpR family regulator/ligand-binding sensor domain-containing protein